MLKFYEHHHDATSGKFHSKFYLIDCSQNTGVLKIMYKITFSLCVAYKVYISINKFHVYICIPLERYLSVFMQKEKI
jgi:hypothetical protein